MRSRVELFEKIRRDRRLDDLSIRELADRHGVHRRTVRQALAAAVPPPRRVYPVRPRPAMDPWVTVIDAWLLADKDAPRKQRHTARRVWQRLVAEHQAALSEVTVSRYVARRRVGLGLLTREVSIPQTHLAGAEAEVDFGEFYSTIAGVVVKCWMFVMRLSHSGKAFHLAFAAQAQEAFLEGHVLAFEYLGCVPGRIRYDNLKPAVMRVLKGRDRTESETVHRAVQPLRVRFVLLPPGHRGRSREGRCGGRDRPLPAASPRPGPQGLLAVSAQRADRRR
jgi:transposase